MISAKVHGIPDLKAALAGIVPKLRVRALRNALAAGARVVQKVSRQGVPTISASSKAVRTGKRKVGTLKKAISVRTSKIAKRNGDVGVFVNVKPAKKGRRGGPDDPFYWAWVEFGHRIIGRFKGKYTDYKVRGRGRLTGLAMRRRSPLGFVKGAAFLRRGVGALPDALRIFTKAIGPQIAKLNKPKAPAP